MIEALNKLDTQWFHWVNQHHNVPLDWTMWTLSQHWSWAIVIALAAGLALGIYTEPFLLTSGGPSGATTTWTLEIYYSAFTKFDSGYATAMAIVYAVEIFIILKILDVVMRRLTEKFGC